MDSSNGKWLNNKLGFCDDAEVKNKVVPNGEGWFWTESLTEFHVVQISPTETQF